MTHVYPLYSEKAGHVEYFSGDVLTMYRSFDVEESEIPAGNYAIRYILQNIVGKELPQEMQYIYWDGEIFI